MVRAASEACVKSRMARFETGRVPNLGGARRVAVEGSEPSGTSDQSSLSPVGDLELGEDGGDVVPDRLLAEVELCGYLCVRSPLCEQVQNLELAIGELGESGFSF